MKNLKILIIISTLILITSFSTYAEDSKMMAGAFINYNLPMGTTADNYKSSIGFHLQFEYLLTESIGLDITAGYVPWDFENAPSNWKFSIIPVLIGTRYYFVERGMSYFGGFDVGVYNTSIKKDAEEFNESNFGISILGGSLFSMGDYLYLNTYLSYTRISTSAYSFTYLSINAGISYPF